jgi:hypothetical protein
MHKIKWANFVTIKVFFYCLRLLSGKATKEIVTKVTLKVVQIHNKYFWSKKNDYLKMI